MTASISSNRFFGPIEAIEEAVTARQGTKIYDAGQAGRGWVWGIEYASADVHPRTGDSTASGRYRIWRGVADGDDWSWKQVTDSRAADNLRPFVPRGSERSGHRALLWMRGRYATYEDFATSVVGVVD